MSPTFTPIMSRKPDVDISPRRDNDGPQTSFKTRRERS